MRNIILYSLLFSLSSCYVKEWYDVNNIERIAGIYSNTETKETLILFKDGCSFFIKKKKVVEVCRWSVFDFDILDAVGMSGPPHFTIGCFNVDAISINEVSKFDYYNLKEEERKKYQIDYRPLDARSYIYYNNKSLVGRGSTVDPDEWLDDIVLVKVAGVSKADSVLKSIGYYEK